MQANFTNLLNQSNGSRILCILAPAITVIFPALSRSKRTPWSLGVDHQGSFGLMVSFYQPFYSEPASENLTSVECLNLLTTIYGISSFMLLRMFIRFLNSLHKDDAVTIPP